MSEDESTLFDAVEFTYENVDFLAVASAPPRTSEAASSLGE